MVKERERERRGLEKRIEAGEIRSGITIANRVKGNAGALTNFEVLDFLRSRGAEKNPTRVIVSGAPSEFKVFDYWEQTAACNQTREKVNEFLKKCKRYNLAKAEILNIINVRPASVVDIDPIINDCEKRLGESIEELVELVADVFPFPKQIESDDDKEEVPQGKQMEKS